MVVIRGRGCIIAGSLTTVPKKLLHGGKIMITVIPKEQRHFSDFEWLKTFWLFSFSEYYDPNNIQHGALRVFNDDIVEPRTGFPTHPHREMEIVTIVLSGQIAHRDSMGNKTEIKAGDVQRMSAGTGLTHSELNLWYEPVHFYQIWIYPDTRGLSPTYDQKSYSPEVWRNTLYPLASGQSFPDAVTFHTDATIYRSELEKENSLDFSTDDSRRIFVYVTSGEITINETLLKEKAQGRIDLESHLKISSREHSNFILIDTPSCKGWGYSKETLQGQKST